MPLTMLEEVHLNPSHLEGQFRPMDGSQEGFEMCYTFNLHSVKCEGAGNPRSHVVVPVESRKGKIPLVVGSHCSWQECS